MEAETSNLNTNYGAWNLWLETNNLKTVQQKQYIELFQDNFQGRGSQRQSFNTVYLV